MKKRILGFIILYTLFICSILYQLRPLASTFWWRPEYQKHLKIYMYPLDQQLNTDLAWAYANQGYKNIANEAGLGIQLNMSEFAFDTNQFALEQYFYYRLTHSNYLTTNASEADLFYLPFFSNMAKVAGQYNMYGKFWTAIKDNVTFINTTSHKHFIIYGGCQKYAQAFSGKLVSQISVIMLERNENKFHPSNIIVAPYPGQIHFLPNRSNVVDYSKKDILASSVWNSRYPIRWELAGMCKPRKDCVHIELYANSDVYNHSYVYEVTERSKFCLSPHGDSPTRKGFWDALLVGCINVIYDNTVKYPFDDIFDYTMLTVYIPMSKRGDTFKILEKFPEDKLRAMQEYIEQNRIHFQYTNIGRRDENTHVPFAKKDAFNLLLDEVYERSLLGH